ncbi:MAG: hypothetical protein IPM80_14020 [Proteobacteria bacterium]|nr:hypothetical protein [Pseudomonadota bacterium]
MFNDLKTRGIGDILIAVTDGLKGLPSLIYGPARRCKPASCTCYATASTTHRGKTAGWRRRSGDLRGSAKRPAALNAFEASATEASDGGSPGWPVSRSSRSLPDPARDLHHQRDQPQSQLRKIIKTRGHFPGRAGANCYGWPCAHPADWTGLLEWRQAMNQFAIAFGERFTNPT